MALYLDMWVQALSAVVQDGAYGCRYAASIYSLKIIKPCFSITLDHPAVEAYFERGSCFCCRCTKTLE